MWGFSFNIYTMAEASDFKFGIQLGFAKVHHKITPIGKSGHGLALGEFPKILRFHFNIYTMAEAIGTSKMVHSLGLPKLTIRPHPVEKWAWPKAREASIYLGFPFNISAAAALSSSHLIFYSLKTVVKRSCVQSS